MQKSSVVVSEIEYDHKVMGLNLASSSVNDDIAMPRSISKPRLGSFVKEKERKYISPIRAHQKTIMKTKKYNMLNLFSPKKKIFGLRLMEGK